MILMSIDCIVYFIRDDWAANMYLSLAIGQCNKPKKGFPYIQHTSTNV